MPSWLVASYLVSTNCFNQHSSKALLQRGIFCGDRIKTKTVLVLQS